MRPISLSQYPLSQGFLLGINFHTIPSRPNTVAISSDFISLESSFAAEVYVVALSDIITTGNDTLATNHRKASRKVAVERSVTISRCTALDVAHMNKQMYTLFPPLCCLTYRAPVKSTPVMESSGTFCTLIFGSGADSGAAYGIHQCLLQIVHCRNSFLTY